MTTVAMPLDKALHILASIHTRDDDDFGFVVIAGGSWQGFMSPYSQTDYMRAWASVRAHLHMQHEPKKR